MYSVPFRLLAMMQTKNCFATPAAFLDSRLRGNDVVKSIPPSHANCPGTRFPEDPELAAGSIVVPGSDRGGRALEKQNAPRNTIGVWRGRQGYTGPPGPSGPVRLATVERLTQLPPQRTA